MDHLVVTGSIVDGRKLFRRVSIPGRAAWAGAPADWPDRWEPGSLNVHIEHPEELVPLGPGNGAQRLDGLHLAPAAVVPAALLHGWLDHDQLGDGLTWRATLAVGGEAIPLWVFRRARSPVATALELISTEYLRSRPVVTDGARVRVALRVGVAEPGGKH